MTIRRTRFPDRFAILPSDTYRFGPVKSDNSRFEVVARTQIPGGVEVLAINSGLIAFDFAGSAELGGILAARFEGSGEVPQEVMESQALVLRVQGVRMQLATFITACIFGTHAHASHSSIIDALFPGLHEIYGWMEPQPGTFGVPAEETPALASRLLRRGGRSSGIPVEHIVAGFELASRLLLARSSYSAADPVALIVMTYQAMILHNRQHAGASVALQALVVEAALEELMYACGLVKGVPARLSVQGLVSPMSKRAVRELKFKGRSDALAHIGVLDAYLETRLETLRKTRNALMHENQDATPQQSGEGLTAVRDLLRYCTNEETFELNMSWSYRC